MAHPPERFRVATLTRSVYVPTLLLGTGMGILLPVLPLYAAQLGAGFGLVGVVVAMRGIGTMAFDVPAGVFVSRWGERRVMIAGTVLTAAGAVGLGLSGAVIPLIAFTFVVGAAHAMWLLSRLAYLSHAVPVEHRGRALSLVGGVTRVGNFGGPVLGGAIGQWVGLEYAFFLQAALALVALAVLLRTPEVAGAPRPVVEHVRNPLTGVGRTLAEHRRLFLTAGTAVVALQVLRTGRQLLIPLWGVEIGLGEAVIGLVFGLSSSLDVLLFYPAGVIMDRWGRKWAAVPAMLLLAGALALFPLSQGLVAFSLVALVSGIGNGLSSGVVMTMGADLSPPGAVGEFLGVWRLIGDLGVAGGPVIVGTIAQIVALALAPVITAGLGVAGAAMMAFLVAETLHRPAPREVPLPLSQEEQRRST